MDLIELLLEYLLELVVTVMVLYGVKLVKAKLNEEQRKLLKEIVKDGVLFAQQVYHMLDGPERYQKALEYISAELEKKKIKISADRLRVIIEAILKDVKKDFGEDWDNSIVMKYNKDCDCK